MGDQQVVIAGAASGAEVDPREQARRTIEARLRQCGEALGLAEEARAQALIAYMSELRGKLGEEDGAAAVAWCDETRARFWELTGKGA